MALTAMSLPLLFTSTKQSGDNGLELRDKAYGICRDYLSGTWKNISSSDMVFKSISGGLSNILFLCSLPSTHTPLNGEPSQVLLRMYGQLHSGNGDGNGASGGDVSTITESVIFMLLSERKLGPKLYGIFPGGRLEEYIPARAMTCQELRDPSLSAIIARKMANVHTLDVPINKEPTWLMQTMENWLDFVRSKSAGDVNETGKEMLIKQLMEFDFESELDFLKDFLKECNSPVVFCHNDMQEGNILLPDYAAAKKSKRSAFTPLTTPVVTDDRVVLIDFEYCSYNHRGFDLANHFCEWAFDYSNPEYPHFFATESNYPSDKQKRSFVREYLKQWAKQSLPDDGLNTEEQLLREADCYTLASHLLWTLWSIHNAFTSEITFGYWEYGKTRMDAYLRHKKRIEQEMNNNLTMST